MDNESFLKEMGERFNVHPHDNFVELETWTSGGVNMLITLHTNEKENLYAQFRRYTYDFDIDEEIDIHREDERYKKDFTISSSLEDFTGFKRKLDEIVDDLNRREYG